MACGGGYDYKLVDEVGKDMYCVICTSLIKRATMFHCGHAFCNLCIVDFMQSSIQRNVKVQCPMRCEQDIYPLVPIPAFDRLISSLNVYCENQNMGCNWKGEISNVEDHLQKACDFREVLCKNCGTVVLHKNLQNHLADCVACPNKCGKKMSKNEVLTHLKICPTQLGSCPFHNVGCSVSVSRNSIERHLKLSINDHLLLVAADSQKTKAEILQSEQLQQKVNELQQEIKLLKENYRLQQQQMEEQRKKMDLLEEGEKLRQQQMNEHRQEIKILKEKVEEQELKITKLTKKDKDQQKEINLLKKKEKNRQKEIQELKETVKKNQDLLQPSPKIQKHLEEISKQGFPYIDELLENKNTSLSTIQQLLLHNPRIIHMRDDCNFTIFHNAAAFNRADVLELLLSVDPSHVDDVSEGNYTALMFGVYQNHIECVRVLLNNNADVNIKDRDEDTPLSWARKKNYVDIIRLLEEH